jgi:phytoene dehydrogenase-like protein
LNAGRRSSLTASTAPFPVHPRAGKLSYVETITVLDRQPAEFGWGDDTIIFFNDSPRFAYERPSKQVDLRSGVICLPNNFAYPDGQRLPEGLFRCTCLANYDLWARLPEDVYRADKQRWYEAITTGAQRFLPALPSADALTKATMATDMFTPRTITKFTGHLAGAIYGSPFKNRQGRTALANVYLCGTDQGFLGIIGAMLSGISMANYHVLKGS